MSKDATDAILRKMRALMAKTEDAGCTEAEAKAAAEALDRLMGEYDVALDDLTVRSTKCDTRVIVQKDKRGPTRETVGAIAKFTDTKAWYSPQGNFTENVCFFGLIPDLDIAEYLYLLFKRSIDKETISYPMFNRAYLRLDAKGRKEAEVSFGIGMALRLSERLMELKSKRDWHTEHETGNALIVLKGQIVTEEYAKLGKELRKDKTKLKVTNRDAYTKGREAGDRVAINQGIGTAGQQKPLK